MTKIEAKRILRKTMIRERQALSIGRRRRLSQRIARHVLKNPVVKKSRVVAVYLDFGSEVQTRPLIEAFWKMGKTVVVPVSSIGFENSYFVLYRPGDALHQTQFGPKEPTPHRRSFKFSTIDVVLVPGLAFDARGGRLGYGGGVYDRLLAKTPQATHIGLYFSSQKLFAIPQDRHDRPLNLIITEAATSS